MPLGLGPSKQRLVRCHRAHRSSSGTGLLASAQRCSERESNGCGVSGKQQQQLVYSHSAYTHLVYHGIPQTPIFPTLN